MRGDRGVTSGVLRDAEPLLVRMTAMLPAKLAELGTADPSGEIVRSRLARMPDSPRVDPRAFYRGLLDLHDALVKAGHPAPLNLIADAMNVSKETIKTRLRVARSRLHLREVD
jgi:hypothetical protein